jgi:hypothetical protein
MYPEYQAKLKAPGGPPQPASGDRATPVRPPETPEIDVLPVQGNIYVIATRSGNITVQTGPAGVLLVDTGTAALSEKVLATVRKLSDKPLRYIINTDLHPEAMKRWLGSAAPRMSATSATRRVIWRGRS